MCPSPPPPSLASWVNRCPLTAWGYELWRARALSLLSGRSFPLEEELALMCRALAPVEGGVFLDLGASTGLYARALLRAGAARVYALDYAPTMLRMAVRKARRHPGLVPLLAYAEAIPLPDAVLDGVAVGGTWNEFSHPERVVQELYRVLRPGGRLWVMFAHRTESPLQGLLERAGLRFPTLWGLRALLEGEGFGVEGWREASVGFVVGTKVARREGQHADDKS
ncbi:MAG: class I SAM-dependent methyltransferase [Meiothermus sp.]|uniref:class I SAM-dependent methyltransferase n=1 Tax=Meiothermus sp. TaxID=1955249 RepID=UPI0025FF0F48|nr:class I SAM-dependent methyltransferase [Meiothermus sp.]MCS7057769.1 class I SAM-dependent methyltransferase [Meiothermus sp.]MCS7194612.1 class I SAM-dependent methyltransferase [Meiothermus sp.]MDW8090979.1 class I SAM-dependent methyltransferase [Meiothermus sp.]MDW8481874.1 class I SAM-dependent methyltransferase [Meiothermus sp.]